MTLRAHAGASALLLLLPGCILSNPAFDPFAASATGGGASATSASAATETSAGPTSAPSTSSATAATTTGETTAVGPTTTDGPTGATTATTATTTTTTTAGDDPCDGPPASWIVRFHGAGIQYAENVAVSKGGDIAVLGTYQGELKVTDVKGTTDGPPSLGKDVFVARFTSSGELTWLRAFPGMGGQIGEDIAFDSLGNVVFAVVNGGTVDFDGGPKTNASNEPDAVLVRLGTDGSHLSSWTYASPGGAAIYDLVVADNDDILIAGAFDTSLIPEPMKLTINGLDHTTAFVARVTPGGSVKWSLPFTGPGKSVAYALAHHAGDQSVLVTGSFSGDDVKVGPTTLIHAANDDIFVAKLNGDTKVIEWAKSAGDTGPQRASDAAFDANGDAVLAGAFLGAIGAGTLVSDHLQPDAFLYRLGGDSAELWGLAAGADGLEMSEALDLTPAGDIAWGADFAGAFAVGACALETATPGFFLAEVAADGAPKWATGYSAGVAAGVESLAFPFPSGLTVVGWHKGPLTIGGEALPSPVDDAEDSFLVRLDASP